MILFWLQGCLNLAEDQDGNIFERRVEAYDAETDLPIYQWDKLKQVGSSPEGERGGRRAGIA